MMDPKQWSLGGGASQANAAGGNEFEKSKGTFF